MTLFPQHDEASAPEAAKATLAAVKADFGMIPNLERTMATAPALLQVYAEGWAAFDTTSLSPIERQVVYQTANLENDCAYCVPWHSLLSEKAGMDPADVEALRQGAALSDPKLEALRRFAQSLVRNRGNVTRAERDAFLAAGYDAQAALEVVLGLAIKTMSNYTNSIAGTPLDSAVRKHAWTKPTLAPGEG
ncbi:MAG: carboxymuconolactone decarboxylase family protein [Pseudomonadota bacterium]